MAFFRRDRTLQSDAFVDAKSYYSELRKGLREKADHNKRESEFFFFGVIACTLTAPLFVTLGEGFWFGKVIPASLSVAAAAGTAWLQMRKPQRLWQIYRRAQRELEREKSFYDFGLHDYEDADQRDKVLARRVSEIAFETHERWEGLVPEPNFGSVLSREKQGKGEE